jgi:intergrase/recombinase
MAWRAPMKVGKANEQQEFQNWYVRSKVRQIMSTSSDTGVVLKTFLLSGLRPEELEYIYSQELCTNTDCSCSNLHIIDKGNGLITVIIRWFRKKKKTYRAIMPAGLWSRFRSLPSFTSSDIDIANRVAKKEAGITLQEIRNLFIQSMSKTMDKAQLQVLGGTADPEVALDCMENKTDLITTNYVRAWQQVNLILPVL